MKMDGMISFLLLLMMVLKVSCYPFGHFGETILNPSRMMIGNRVWEYGSRGSMDNYQGPLNSQGYFPECPPCVPFMFTECPCDYYKPWRPTESTPTPDIETFKIPTWIRIDNETEWYLSAINRDSWHVAEAKAISLGGHLLEIREDSFSLINKEDKKKGRGVKTTTMTKRRSRHLRGLLGKVLKKYNVPLWFGVNALAGKDSWVWSSNGEAIRDLKYPFWNVLDSQGECGDLRLLNGVLYGFQVSCEGLNLTPRGFIVVRKRTKDDDDSKGSAQGNDNDPSIIQPTPSSTPHSPSTYYPPTPVRFITDSTTTTTILITTSQMPTLEERITPGSPPSPV